MKKKQYEKPSVEVVVLKHRSNLLLQASAQIDSYEEEEFSW